MSLAKSWDYEVVFSLWFCCFLLPVSAQDFITDPTEVDALKIIKQSLVDRNGNLSNWNSGDPCRSNWTGVVCYNTTLVDGYLHVQELQLLSMNFSGTLAPEIGRLAYLTILSFMWNNISGSIPKEIGNIYTLELLLLNGNHLTGPLPEELGYLPNLNRIQIDQNKISGPLPASFANLNMTKHFHMNNNSISGQIPPELSRMPNLVHLLLDNNNLSGYLPPELSEMPNILIIQLDNNNFSGNTIPASYGNMSKLLKLSLRNCSLQGSVPDLSRIPELGYLDLSSNELNGSIPPNKLSDNVTTIDLSNNELTGTIPSYFSLLPLLQRLSIANNSLNGSIPSTIWQSKTLNATESFIMEFQHNSFTSISGSTSLPPNVSLWLEGNPLCSNDSLAQFCGLEANNTDTMVSTYFNGSCPSAACPPPFEYSPSSPEKCFCAAPLIVEYRLKSPGISAFPSYIDLFENYLTDGLKLFIYQLHIDTYFWEEGPRLRMLLKLYPVYLVQNQSSHIFNRSEVLRLRSMFTGWLIPDNDIFGPYELLGFHLLDPYKDLIETSRQSSRISTGALIGIIIGTIACAVIVSVTVSLLIVRVLMRRWRSISKRHQTSKVSIKIDGVRAFTYEEMAQATNNFSNTAQVGQGGYGKVYKGNLADGTVVAIKRAQEGSLQGEREFLTEIQLLSRLHHRNLVSLVGYCDEEGEQMLVYEFMSNGTLRDHLSANSKEALSFAMRMRIALGSAKGILYLHTEADPPIFHRDVKASNILLDSKFTAKVADFGLSRLAPVPDIEGVVPAHVSTVVKGTPGYLDPEYFLTHKLTDKSDVYSLGVVFLELLTGMQPISHGKNIVREVNIAYQSGVTFSVVDGRMGSYSSECVEKFLNLSLKCCQDEPDARPKMAEVVRELENIWALMPESDTRRAESITPGSDSGKLVSSSSSSTVKTPFVSGDVSGSDLVSGVVPIITPR
ncbi:probable LRR receptor-like serine/threonine-protein kinase At1g06840 [Prosopis cineraria]|uniref:probable LRR receptor-like serine/threonine-protein kinase At1g06840 n=1 Tax=Prosopis cineraria TaxID=364024 RepID=UPI00240EF3AF|nr:probable LRR receptor-like serine/threonine-protein kinase At1g06840 [Prosopis cineraria]XP_054797367.1 probable LRR receptor-like serine/threonine-protein kinase At1g06840 [Prosopis cineraria]